jgi:hypothetical protein
MTLTYNLIAKATTTATTSFVTLTSIPSTYTHLKFYILGRQTGAGLDAHYITFNGGTYTGFTGNYMDAGSASPRSGSVNYYQIMRNPTDYGTNTWTFNESIITNYAGANEKNFTNYHSTTNNAGPMYHGSTRTYTAITSAITSATIGSYSGGDYEIGTSFYIYGLSNQ